MGGENFLGVGVGAGSADGVGAGSTSIEAGSESVRDWKMLEAMRLWPVLAVFHVSCDTLKAGKRLTALGERMIEYAPHQRFRQLLPQRR